MKAFSERNPITLAVVGVVAILALGTGVYFADDLPVIGGGATYTADFTDASGLKAGDDVRIAGVKIGKVDSISLAGTHVQVQFKAKDAWIGDASIASIKIKTLLGQEYVQIEPFGDHRLSPSTPIPVSRTRTPIDVNAALSGLGSTLGKVDTTQLARSFDTLSATFAHTPTSLRAALTGLSSLSHTISSRDAQLRSLASNADALSGTVAGSNRQFAALITDGAALLQELQARSTAITALLAGTRQLSVQLSGLVHDDSAVLAPALAQLSRVTTILTGNQANLSKALSLLGPYYSLINNAAGNGPWIDIYICGLFNHGTVPDLSATSMRNCTPRAGP